MNRMLPLLQCLCLQAATLAAVQEGGESLLASGLSSFRFMQDGATAEASIIEVADQPFAKAWKVESLELNGKVRTELTSDRWPTHG